MKRGWWIFFAGAGVFLLACLGVSLLAFAAGSAFMEGILR